MRKALVFLLLLSCGCSNLSAAAKLGSTIGEYELVGRMLPVRSRFGRDVFDSVRRGFSSAQGYCNRHGYPDYVLIEQPGVWFVFSFLYAKRDTVVYFRSPNPVSVWGHFGKVIEETPIPRALWGRMSDADQALAASQHSTAVKRSLYGRWDGVYAIGERRSR